MQTQVGRLNHYHNTKRQVLGNHPGAAAPAWKTNQQMVQKKGSGSTSGSKILLSKLPIDVNEAEVESLFKKTVGPTKDVFMVYNGSGKSKGMAIVEFHHPGDARIARQKYNKKIIDGRRPIVIEIIKDEDEDAPLAPPISQVPSLLQRLGDGALPLANGAKVVPKETKAATMNNIAARKQQQAAHHVQGLAAKPKAIVSRQKARIKKGPRRLKKTVEQLDLEMDDYRAHSDDNAVPMKTA